MSDILNKTIVLVLNRNWRAINIRTPQDAFCQMATNATTALDIELGEDSRAQALRPVTWDEWITLPVREGDHAVLRAGMTLRQVGMAAAASRTQFLGLCSLRASNAARS